MHKRVSKFSARTEICNVIPRRNKKAKSLLTKNLAVTFLGWRVGLEPTTFRTTI